MFQVKKSKRLLGTTFTVYLLILLYWMFFGLSRRSNGFYKYNFTPFSTIKKYFLYFDHFPFSIWLMNIAGNVGVFIPFGIFLPLLFKRLQNFFGFTFVFVLGISTLETFQLISRLGSFDVDDIILNTLGAIIGYITYTITRIILLNKK